MICQLIFLLISVVLFSAVTGENFPPIVQQTEFDSEVVQQTEFDSEVVQQTEFDSDDEFCECGTSQDEKVGTGKSERIMGREVQPPYKYPWMVALYRTEYHNCGGSLITQTFVLTAAHCFLYNFRLTPTDGRQLFCRTENNKTVQCFVDAFWFRVGVSGKETTVNKFYDVKRYIKHPKFDLTNLMYDFALIELREPIGCSPYTRPICLPDEVPAPPALTEVIVSGWGYTEDEKISKELLEAKLRIQPKNWCEGFNPNSKTHICAIGRWQSTCAGDSGGPLFYAVKGKYYIFGVTSFGLTKDCESKLPDFYGDVKQALDWIHQTTNAVENIPSTPFPLSSGNWTAF